MAAQLADAIAGYATTIELMKALIAKGAISQEDARAILESSAQRAAIWAGHDNREASSAAALIRRSLETDFPPEQRR